MKSGTRRRGKEWIVGRINERTRGRRTDAHRSARCDGISDSPREKMMGDCSTGSREGVNEGGRKGRRVASFPFIPSALRAWIDCLLRGGQISLSTFSCCRLPSGTDGRIAGSEGVRERRSPTECSEWLPHANKCSALLREAGLACILSKVSDVGLLKRSHTE